MDKERSTELKGVAILMMIFLHLFNQLPNVLLCHNLIFIDDLPLVYVLSRFMNPVGLFLLLGGYGLYKVWYKGDNHRWSRILKLYIHFWVILTIFVTIGHFILPHVYPGDFFKIIENYTSFKTSYNGELWFLLPYAFLSVISPFICRVVIRIKWYLIVLGTLGLKVFSIFLVTRCADNFIVASQAVAIFLQIINMLFNFTLGILAARFSIIEKIHALIKNSLAPILIKKRIKYAHAFICVTIIILVIISGNLKYNFFYDFFLILILAVTPFPVSLSNILVSLGRKSMDMWMIHSWFCYYLFKQFIYGFKYPIIIYTVLVIISYISAIATGYISETISNRIIKQ